MARATTKKKLTGRQQEIVDLMKGQPDITPAEIAELLETSPGAVYQQISRLRAGGHLPKAGAKRTRTRVQAAPAHKAEPDIAPALNNGSLTLEEHVQSDLQTTVTRIAEIEGTVAELESERTELTSDRERLEKVQQALTA